MTGVIQVNTEDEANLRRLLNMEGLDQDATERLMREFYRIYRDGMVKHYRMGVQDSNYDYEFAVH